jgi:dTDP-glucose pyrophosphorylase
LLLLPDRRTLASRSSLPHAPTRIDKAWRKALLPPNATVQEAIRNLDASALQIVLIVTEGDVLLGTLTDGDIRRGLLRGLDLSSAVESLMTHEPLVVPEGISPQLAAQLMQVNKIHQLPVVDERRRVVGLRVWHELKAPGQRPNLMVIMAGGRGTRLRPHTEDCPKPLLEVSGKPMLQHIIERAKSEGFSQFVIAINYLGEMIERFFADGARWQVRIEYLRESAPLGTAGAITLLDPRPEAPFVVSNGDVLTDIHYGDLLEFHCRHGAAATMAVRQHEWQHPFGVVRTEGIEIVGFDEKPIARTHINAGVYVLEPASLDALEVGKPCDMPALFGRLQDRGGRTIAYPMHEPWLDVGREADLERAYALRRPARGEGSE